MQKYLATDDVFVLLSSHDSRSFVFSLSSRLPRPLFLPFLRPLDIALFFSSTYDAGACLIFARSRRLQLSRNLPTADTVEKRKGKEKEIEF